MSDEIAAVPAEGSKNYDKVLFWGCFVALVATAFAFNIRANVVGTWQTTFGLSETEKGQILGALFWPFGISIVLFSLVIDKIGYGKSMIFAFACHVASVVVTVLATGYWGLYIGSCLCGLAAGTVEAVVNPVVASMFPKNKTKMLTILHAGWAGGVALCGAIVMVLGPGVDWKTKTALLLIPTALYGLMLLRRKFPVSERVASGVPYKDMLKECGVLGMLIVTYMIVRQVGSLEFTQWSSLTTNIITLAIVAAFGLYTRSLGRPMYTFLLLVMILLAITELGTDGWIKELRDPAMRDAFGLDGGWILAYTASIMMLLRFCIGPIVKVLKPLGVLFVSALFAAAGLFFLASAEGAWIIVVTATIYGIGQAFFWPVTIGICAERFPKGGALTINVIAGVGMLGVGIIGFPMMGFMQDTHIEKKLEPAIFQKMAAKDDKTSVLGTYRPLDRTKVSRLDAQVGLYDRSQVAAKAAGPDADLAAALAKDEKYTKLMTANYDLLVRKSGDKGEKTFEEMQAGLKKEGLLVDAEQHKALSGEREAFTKVNKSAKVIAMEQIAILPLIMAACYLGLIIYFKTKGGYKAVDLSAEGEVVGEHEVTPEEAVADAEETPSE